MHTTRTSPLRTMTRSLAGISFGTLLLGAWSCSADLENDGGDPYPVGTIVEECPVGYTCETNEDGSIVVVGKNDPGNGNGNGSGSGGFTSTGGASGVGGSTVGTGGVQGTGGSAPTCTDVQHPDHLDKPCSVWVEWGECDSGWMNGYCDATCGRCTPDTGSGGGSGSGGTGGGGGLGNETLPDIQGGQTGWASRYWDCCKPHCAWPAHGATVPACGQNGTSHVDANAKNACESGGSAYTCYSQAPRAVSNNISYGYVAVPSPQCGQCYHLQFTGEGQHNSNDPGSKAIQGKHMIVKVTNTGGDVSHGQFDLMIPGGGVGIFQGACSAQWGQIDMGAQYGGFLTSCSGDHNARKQCVRNKCNQLPAGEVRDACNWFVDWFQVADNPKFRYEPTNCPAGL